MSKDNNNNPWARRLCSAINLSLPSPSPRGAHDDQRSSSPHTPAAQSGAILTTPSHCTTRPQETATEESYITPWHTNVTPLKYAIVHPKVPHRMSGTFDRLGSLNSDTSDSGKMSVDDTVEGVSESLLSLTALTTASIPPRRTTPVYMPPRVSLPTPHNSLHSSTSLVKPSTSLTCLLSNARWGYSSTRFAMTLVYPPCPPRSL
jgi:hypothetical protein